MWGPDVRGAFSRLAVRGYTTQDGRWASHTHWPDRNNPQQVSSARDHTCWSSHVPERASW